MAIVLVTRGNMAVVLATRGNVNKLNQWQLLPVVMVMQPFFYITVTNMQLILEIAYHEKQILPSSGNISNWPD